MALVGTAGVGKSRVVHEFVDTLRRRDWQVLEAECNPLEQAVPFCTVLKKLVQRALGGSNSLPLRTLAPGGRRIAHSDLWPAGLCAVLDQPVTDPRWDTLEPFLRRRVMIDAARDVLARAISTQPTCCCWRICTGSTAKVKPLSTP